MPEYPHKEFTTFQFWNLLWTPFFNAYSENLFCIIVNIYHLIKSLHVSVITISHMTTNAERI